MPRSLPLYESAPDLALSSESPLGTDPSCTRCSLHKGAHSVCVPAEGEPGGLLVVGEGPGRKEDQEGRPFVGETGRLLRRLLAKHWKGPVVLANATGCFPARQELSDKHVDACRPYLAQVLAEAKPIRIVALGGYASLSLLGQHLAPLSTRRAYTRRPDGTPVFFLLHPAAGLRNRFILRWFEEDLAWATVAEPPELPTQGRVLVCSTAREVEEAASWLRRSGRVAFDVETAGGKFDPSFRIVSLSACPEGWEDAFFFGPDVCSSPALRAPLEAWLADPGQAKGGHNVQYDTLSVWAAWGVWVGGVAFDTRLLRKLLEPASDARLAVAASLVGMVGHKDEAKQALDAAIREVRRTLKAQETPPKTKPKTPFRPLSSLGLDPTLAAWARNPDNEPASWAYACLPPTVLARYNARDAVSTMRLLEVLEPRLKACPPLAATYARTIMPAARAITHVEAAGIHVNQDALRLFDMHLAAKEVDLQRALGGYAPDVNWASPDQIAGFFFGQEGLTPTKLTPGGKLSTDEEALEDIAHKHPAGAALLEYRKVTKLRGTYAAGLQRHIRANGRVHCSILLDGAASGRASVRDPSLQTIPSEKNDPADGPFYGRMARDIFSAPKGKVLVSLDFSQLELRVAAILSGDIVMKEAFLSGEDYHLRTAKMISHVAWGIPPEKVGKEHRSAAKALNFGVLYGKTARSFAKQFNVSVEEAQKIVDAISGAFKGFSSWCKERIREAEETGLSWTVWEGAPARVRHLYRIADTDEAAGGYRSNARNASINTPIQGSASDFCTMSLVRSVNWLCSSGFPAKLVLPIHDALLFEVEEAYAGELVDTVGHFMVDYDTKGVPMVVDADAGPAWGSLEKVRSISNMLATPPAEGAEPCIKRPTP